MIVKGRFMFNDTDEVSNKSSLLKELLSAPQSAEEMDYRPEFVAKIKEAVKHTTGPMTLEEAIQRGYLRAYK